MSSSSEYSAVSCPKPTPEKSIFSQTCNLLSQYLKEKGTFGDLALGMSSSAETNGSPETSCHSATTRVLFPTKENNMAPSGNLTTMDLLSPYGRHLGEEVPTHVNASALKSVGKEPKAAQLTIFYAGKVVVFDDFPANKVEEIMFSAKKGISHSPNSSAYAYTQGPPPGTFIQEEPQAPCGPIISDLPMARKTSLQRFLEKRKDRIAARAPYQISNPIAASNKPAATIPWLGLGAK